MFTRRRLFALLASLPVLADLLITSFVHSAFWSQLLPSFYYGAIIIAGLTLGWKAGLGMAFISGVAHSLIGYFLGANAIARLEAQLIAFLVVGFALIEERRRANRQGERTSGKALESGPMIPPEVCTEQLSAIASELISEARAPLSSIEGASFILEEDPELPHPEEFIQIIRRECSRLSHAFAEISASTQALHLNREPTDISTVLGEVVRLSSLEIPAPTIDLRTEVAPNLPQVWCDKTAISRAIAPFVTSAMNSMPSGGEIMLFAERQNGQARIHLKVLGQTVRASDVAAGRGPHSATFDLEGGLRIVAARRTLLQHGGMLQVEQAGRAKKLVFFTLPLYNEQWRWIAARY